jgi:hypothetical protein
MLSNDQVPASHGGSHTRPEPLGFIVSVSGSQASVQLRWKPPSDSADVDDVTVGKLLIIRAKHSRIIGVMTKISMESRSVEGPHADYATGQIDLLGEIRQDGSGPEYFQRGVTEYPMIGRRHSDQQFRIAAHLLQRRPGDHPYRASAAGQFRCSSCQRQ